LSIFIQDKKTLIGSAFIFFLLAFFVRLFFLFFYNPSAEKLVEDELLYWNSALIYLDKGSLEESIMAERMPGIFIYSKILLALSFKNLKIYLVFQALIDALTCIVMYKTGSIIFPKQKTYIYLSATLSPLMIILSSQVLSETIFLFFFTIFLFFSVKILSEKNHLYYKMAIAGFFLGLATCIRSLTYPLVFLSIVPFVIVLIKNNTFKNKIIIACITFLFFALLPLSPRIYDNIINHSTYVLTSQSGTHLAYWVAPMIISETKNINRNDAIKYIDKVAKKYPLTEDYYKNDQILRKVGIKVLSEVNKVDLTFHWTKAGLINLIAPSILIDKSLRVLPHPSYYETGNILAWLKLIYSNSEYHKYLIYILIASISSIFTIISLIIGPLFIFRNQRIIFYITTLYILYFLLITGPVLSPKYILPILPCIFLYQGITLFKIISFLENFKK
tara:strand:+ start:201 stop:1538 length:1338 start_codon:yes stop_codon:yes gene_type:complete